MVRIRIGLPATKQELFWNLTSHAEAFASGYYDYVIHFLNEELKVKSEEF